MSAATASSSTQRPHSYRKASWAPASVSADLGVDATLAASKRRFGNKPSYVYDLMSSSLISLTVPEKRGAQGIPKREISVFWTNGKEEHSRIARRDDDRNTRPMNVPTRGKTRSETPTVAAIILRSKIRNVGTLTKDFNYIPHKIQVSV